MSEKICPICSKYMSCLKTGFDYTTNKTEDMRTGDLFGCLNKEHKPFLRVHGSPKGHTGLVKRDGHVFDPTFEPDICSSSPQHYDMCTGEVLISAEMAKFLLDWYSYLGDKK